METRFEFGENWRRFLALVDEPRIRQAEASLQPMLGRERLNGLGFLDIGSGSGLFSLAARRLGARVHAFDYDSQSVACTMELRRDADATRRYVPMTPAGRSSKARRSTMHTWSAWAGSTWCTRGACCNTRARCGTRWKMPRLGSSPVACY